MVARDKLKEYALKIFNGDKDYSLQKVYRLFPKYFLKIAFYYTELVSQKQEELTRSMMKSLGVIKAVELKKIAAAAHRQMIIYKNKVINNLRTLDKYKEHFDADENTANLYAYIRHSKSVQIYDDIEEIFKINDKALKAVEKTAQKYRYNDIFTEAATYVIKNREILRQIYDVAKYYAARID